MIRPERTAISRRSPSLPAQKFLESELRKDAFVLDWGCGKGFDYHHFLSKGFKSDGYDPYYEPYLKDKLYDYVTCFYVLNVVPNIADRVRAIKQAAFKLKSNGKMYIAVRSKSDVKPYIHKWKKYKDGYLTSKDTFQSGFTNLELELLIKKAGFRYKKWQAPFVGALILK